MKKRAYPMTSYQVDGTRVFGPVPSRRLGRSIGINNIPSKICSYACVYCQIGRAIKMSAVRQKFYDPDELFAEVKKKVERVRFSGEKIDYLTIVPDGEPTLDINLGRLIDLLKSLNIPVGVIINTSLIDMPDVRAELYDADWISLKTDAVSESIWKKIDRPHQDVNLEKIHSAAITFAQQFAGQLVTETMLIQGINDSEEDLSNTAKFISKIKPSIAYIGIPTRPPAEKWAIAPSESKINQAYQIFSQHVDKVECLIGYEGNEFSSSGNTIEDVLSITAVHPMREDAILEYLRNVDDDFIVIDEMVRSGRLIVTEYRGNRFYLRNLKR